MRKQQRTEKSKKLRLIRIVTVELIIMAVSVCVSIMPMPYRLIVPIIIGARAILMKAHQYAKAPPAPEAVHSCATAEPKRKSKTEIKSIEQNKFKDEEAAGNKKTARKGGKK